jgi:uncharacterized membrane protein
MESFSGRPATKRQHIGRVALGLFLMTAGTGHLTFARVAFRAQVPDWVPLDVDATVVLSGIVEIVLGLSFVALRRYRKPMAWILAIFFIMVFPGNIAQYLNRRDAFGLDTDGLRLMRLFFQPLLVIWPLWAANVLPPRKVSRR